MKYQQMLNFLYNLKGSERKGGFNLNLKNVKNLLSKIGDPHKELNVILVGGTNGKGSTCAMISSILQEAKLRVGMYTSPHLVDFRERFMINGKMISHPELKKSFSKIKKHITNQTFFEVVTAIAFDYFNRQSVDYLVCEVGLGGRGDSTNVVNPVVSVITNIGMDHEDYLGNTITKIATEKAGIIKRNGIVVTGAHKGIGVIQRIAKKKSAEIIRVVKPYPYELKVAGVYQRMNASVAVAAVWAIEDINEEIIKKALKKVTVIGRMQKIKKNMLIDCAHNLDAVLMLKAELALYHYDKLYLVIGMLMGKPYQRIMDQLTGLCEEVILVKPPIERGLNPYILSAYSHAPSVIYEDWLKGVRYARKKAKSKDLILCTGSIYLISEILAKSKHI